MNRGKMADACPTPQKVSQDRRPRTPRRAQKQSSYEPSREDLLYMVSVLEGELQARDVVIETIKRGKPEAASALASLRYDSDLAWVEGQQNGRVPDTMSPGSTHHLDQIHQAMDWHQRVYQEMIEEIDTLQYHQRQLQIQSEVGRNDYFKHKLGVLDEFIQQDKATDLVQAMMQHDSTEKLPCMDCPFCQIMLDSKEDGSLYEAEMLYSSLKGKNGFNAQETEFKQLLVLMAMREMQMKSLVEELKLLQRKVHKFRKKLHDMEHKDGLKESAALSVGKDIISSLENMMYTICTKHLQEDKEMQRPKTPENNPNYEEIWIDQSPYDPPAEEKNEHKCSCGEKKYEQRMIDTFVKLERSVQTEEIEPEKSLTVDSSTQTDCPMCQANTPCLCFQKKPEIHLESKGIQTHKEQEIMIQKNDKDTNRPVQNCVQSNGATQTGFRVKKLAQNGVVYATQSSEGAQDVSQVTNGVSTNHEHMNGTTISPTHKKRTENGRITNHHVNGTVLNGYKHNHGTSQDGILKDRGTDTVKRVKEEVKMRNEKKNHPRPRCLSPLSWDCNQVLDAVLDESNIIEENDINHNLQEPSDCKPITANIRISLLEEDGESPKTGLHPLCDDSGIMGSITIEPTVTWGQLERQISTVIEQYSVYVCSDDLTESLTDKKNCTLTLGLSGKDVQRYRAGSKEWSPGNPPQWFSRPKDMFWPESKDTVDIFAVFRDVTEESLARLALETFIPLAILEEYMQLIKYHKGVVFTGPTGFCKKEIALDLALCLENDLQHCGVDAHVQEVSSYSELTEYLQSGDVSSPLGSVNQSVSTPPPAPQDNKATIIVFQDIQDVSEMESFAQFISMATTWSGAVLNGDVHEARKHWYFIATMDDAIRMEFVDWSLQHQLFWVSLNSELSPGKDMLWRYFKSLIIQQQRMGQHCRSEAVHQAVKWIFQVWQRLNKFFTKLELNELLLGPKYFYTCPVQADNPKKILRWMSVMWNSWIAPNVKQALSTRSGENVSEDVVMNVLSGVLHKAVEPGCPAMPDTQQYLKNFAGYKVIANHSPNSKKLILRKTTKAVDTEV